MRPAIAVLALAALAACTPAPAPAPTGSPSPTPRPPAAAFAAIGPALRAAGSAEVRIRMTEGTAEPTYTADFTVLFRTGAFRARLNLDGGPGDSYEVVRVPPDLLIDPPDLVTPRPSGPPWIRMRPSTDEASAQTIAQFEAFVASLSLPGCAPHVTWRGTEQVATTLVQGYNTDTVSADRYEALAPVAACVPAPPLLAELPSQAPVRIWIAADGRPIRYEADLETERLRIGFDEFGTVDAVQTPGPEEIRNL